MTEQTTNSSLTTAATPGRPKRRKRLAIGAGSGAVVAAGVAAVYLYLPLYLYLQFKLMPERTTTAIQTVETWLDCEECTSDQLKQVVAYDRTTLPILTATLYEGPSKESQADHQERLRTQYSMLRQNTKKREKSLSEEEYVKTYLRMYVIRHQARAAEAIAKIGGKEAQAVLCEALKRPIDGDVKADVQRLSKKGGGC